MAAQYILQWVATCLFYRVYQKTILDNVKMQVIVILNVLKPTALITPPYDVDDCLLLDSFVFYAIPHFS